MACERPRRRLWLNGCKRGLTRATARRVYSTTSGATRCRAAASSVARSAGESLSASAISWTVSLRDARHSPRSRSLMLRGLSPAWATSSPWVSLASHPLAVEQEAKREQWNGGHVGSTLCAPNSSGFPSTQKRPGGILRTITPSVHTVCNPLRGRLRGGSRGELRGLRVVFVRKVRHTLQQ